MLEWAWFVVLTIVGVGLSVFSVARSRENPEQYLGGMEYVLASVSALLLSLNISSEVTVAPLFRWFCEALPQHATDINQFSAALLTCMVSLGYILCVPLLAVWVDFQLVDKRRLATQLFQPSQKR